jgi:hypothetical protein
MNAKAVLHIGVNTGKVRHEAQRNPFYLDKGT